MIDLYFASNSMVDSHTRKPLYDKIIKEMDANKKSKKRDGLLKY